MKLRRRLATLLLLALLAARQQPMSAYQTTRPVAVARDEKLSYPAGLAVGPDGTVYVADQSNNVIRQISATGRISTLAGNVGYSGSADGPGPAASFNAPCDVAVGADGTVYVADTGNNAIRTISPAGVVRTLAGNWPDGRVDGRSADLVFSPSAVAVDAAGTVYVADGYNNLIREVSREGIISTLAGDEHRVGYADGIGTAARFYEPTDVALGPDDRLYVADFGNHRIRCVTPSGTVTTLAGTVPPNVADFSMYDRGGYADGPGATARFKMPSGVAVDAAGTVYVADRDNLLIRRISPAGVVSTLAGTVDTEGHHNGPGAAARFASPTSVALTATGSLLVSDSQNDLIRRISPAGVVSTWAGTRRRPYREPLLPDLRSRKKRRSSGRE